MGHPYPPLRPYAVGDVWAMTADEATSFDAWAIREVGVPQPVLMENAGRAVAAIVQRLHPTGPVVGAVGAGNNGGDALVALRCLAAWGRSVRAVLVADRDRDDPLLHGWSVEVVTDAEAEGLRAGTPPSDVVVVDGVLGTGVRGAPRDRQARAIEWINRSGAPVIAVDLPSGVDASTGATPGAAVRAAVTVSFGAPKVGTLLHPARALVGRLLVAEIGFPPLPKGRARVRVATPDWARARVPARGTDTHKNAVGRVTVVAGQEGMAGAAILAARGALRSGAGLVRVASVRENRSALQAALPEALFVDAEDAPALGAALEACDAVVAGPGLGTSARAARILAYVLDGPARPTVLDADALNLTTGPDGPPLAGIAAGRPLLVTPHPGEMARLWADAPALDGDRVSIARAAAERFGCVVLAKGAPSVVAGTDGVVVVDTQSSSDLAVAGLGDVLSGVCGGLAAQGCSLPDAASVGLYFSGRAACLAGRGAGLTPSDVLRWLPDARAEVGGAASDLAAILPFVTFDADAAR